jgi:hypothetical protein
MSHNNTEIMNIGIVIVIVIILVVICACLVNCICTIPPQTTGKIRPESDPSPKDGCRETHLDFLRREIQKKRWNEGLVHIALELVSITDDPQDIIGIVYNNMRPGTFYDSDTWNEDRTKLVWERLAELCDPKTISDVIRKFPYMGSSTKSMFHKKWVAKANTFDEISLIPTLYEDQILEQVRIEKLDRLTQEALTAAHTCTEIMIVWDKIPTSSVLKSASVANLPAWNKDSGVILSRIKAMTERAPEGSPIKADANTKWLKLSIEKVDIPNTVREFWGMHHEVHPEAQSSFIERWNKKSLDDLETVMTVESAHELANYSPKDSTSQASATKRWNDLSLSAIEAASSFPQVLNAHMESPLSSEARAAGAAKCSSLASTEQQVRKAWNMEGVNEEIRKQLTAKLASILES